jgi:hypothetical protein
MVVKQVCAPRFTPVQLVFQNQYGGYDSFTFRLLSRQQKKIDRTTFKSLEYRRVGTDIAFASNGVHFGGTTAFSTSVDYSYRVTSNYLTLEDYNLGSELLASNEVYLYVNDANGENYYPILMKETSWESKVVTSDKMFNYELGFDLGINQQSQYR